MKIISYYLTVLEGTDTTYSKSYPTLYPRMKRFRAQFPNIAGSVNNIHNTHHNNHHTTNNFHRIVKEASVTYPRVRMWTEKILRGRDTHHGYSHAQEVRALSRTLACTDGVLSRDAYPLMYTIAILHDVADYKVDLNGWYEHELNRFLFHTTTPHLHQFIRSSVSRVSMSYERKAGTADWNTVLGPAGVLIRNYVSDADKLLCLGAKGHVRIVEYNEFKILQDIHGEIGTTPADPRRELYKNPLYYVRLVSAVNDVMETRMRIVPQFIRTPTARSRALSMMTELFCAHEKWKSQF